MRAGAAPFAIVRGRIALAVAVCAAAFVFLGVRLVDVTVFGAAAAAAGALRDTGKASPLRADLLDRNGVLIARDLPVRDLYASPAAFWDIKEAAFDLARATGADEKRLKRVFSPKKGYVAVKRALTPGEQEAVMRLGLPALTFEDGFKRYYPGGRAAAHVVGEADVDGQGVSGLELGLDRELRGNGQPLELSLDMRVQYALAREVAASQSLHAAKAAGGIVLDVQSGEVLALVSFPDFEPNSRAAKEEAAARNRMTQDVYELGSVFKIFTFAEAIEERSVRLEETFDVGRPLRMGRYAIEDVHRLGPKLTGANVFVESSNIGAAQIGLRLGAERQRAFLGRLGLLAAVKSEIPESAAPLIPANWKAVETATIAFGHGLSVSPLAFAAAAAAVVNGGTRIVPTFLKRDRPQKGERVLSASTSATMRGLMRQVVEKGTGTKAGVPGYAIGGKTGTAEKAHNRGYLRKSLISSFCAVFPIEDPRYLVFVMLDEPKGTKDTSGFATAGYTSAPLAGRVIGRIAPLLGVARNDALAAAESPLESTMEP